MVKLLTYVITVLLSLVFVNTKKAAVEFYEEKVSAAKFYTLQFLNIYLILIFKVK